MTKPHDKAIEAAAKAVDPDLFSDDPVIAHRAASPITVEAARKSVIDALTRAIAAYERAMWRPIEEAPKDGTQIIAYGPGRYKPFYVGTTAWSEGWIGKWPIAYMGYAAGEPTLFRICPLPPVPEDERMTTTPNARVILPAEATEEMMLSGMASAERMATATQGDAIIDGYSSMVSASPNAGRVTTKMLEAAARAICFSDGQTDWPLDEGDRSDFRRMARAAFEAIGLTVEG